MGWKRRGHAIYGALLVGGILAGCSMGGAATPAPETSWEPSHLKELASLEATAGNVEQAEALEDGVVTFEEYKAAFDRLATCLDEAGINASPPVVSPVSNDRFEFCRRRSKSRPLRRVKTRPPGCRSVSLPDLES